MKIKKIQWRPNWIANDRRLVLSRVYFEKGTPGDGHGWSAKISTSLTFALTHWLVGFQWRRKHEEFFLWLCPFPCLAIRFHWLRSWGGRMA